VEREAVEQRVRELCEAGEIKHAASVVIQGLGPELFGFLVVMVGNLDDAGDVFTDSCTRIWKGLASFRWESSLRTWCYVLARRACYAHRKTHARPPHVPLSAVPELDELIQRLRTTTLVTLRERQQTRVERLRAQLTADERALLTLRVDRELEWRDIARVLADGDAKLDDETLERESALLRKKFERLKAKLRRLAAADHD
jgi:RNA polymerase sigma-70 factor, ECF subfamily